MQGKQTTVIFAKHVIQLVQVRLLVGKHHVPPIHFAQALCFVAASFVMSK
jgi:hypothetical protein